MSDNLPSSDVLPPLQVTDGSSVDWDERCDVLVVGWGAAGACAALEARAQGADVLIADRFTGGGASAKSGGWSTPVAVRVINRPRASTTAPKPCSITSSTKPGAW
jgi:hypothetical protein